MIATALTILALQAEVRDYEQDKLGQFTPFAVLEVSPSLRLQGEVFSIYAPFRTAGGVGYLAVRRIVTGYHAPDVEQWAVASECPGAHAVLLDLEALQPPRIDVPTIGRDDHQGPGLDGVSYKLFVRYPTWPDSFAYKMSFSTNEGSPLAAWTDRLRAVLTPCWTTTRPQAQGDARSQ